MKLVRYRAGSHRDIGVIIDGEVVSLSDFEQSAGRETLVDGDEPPRDALIEWMWRHGERGFAEVEHEIGEYAADPSVARSALDDVELLAPLHAPQRIIASGNFREHFEEVGRSPRYPSAVASGISASPDPKSYLTSAGSIVGPFDDIPYPKSVTELDYEVELAVVIGRRIKDVSPAEARAAVFGVTVANDVSARDIQFAEVPTGLLNRGKNLDAMLPLGPWIETDWEACLDGEMQVRVNGEDRQKYPLGKMERPMEELISHYSKDTTLLPGDVVLSGTCPGPAAFQDNYEELVLKPGDLMETTITSIGTLRNRIV